MAKSEQVIISRLRLVSRFQGIITNSQSCVLVVLDCVKNVTLKLKDGRKWLAFKPEEMWCGEEMQALAR
jgi:hypothetical protein